MSKGIKAMHGPNPDFSLILLTTIYCDVLQVYLSNMYAGIKTLFHTNETLAFSVVTVTAEKGRQHHCVCVCRYPGSL